MTATLVTGALAVVLALAGTFEALLAAYAPIGVLIAVMVNVSLLRLRRRWPERARPCRARGYPWSVAAVLAVNMLLAAGFIVDDPTSGACTLAALGASYPLFRLARRLPAVAPAMP